MTVEELAGVLEKLGCPAEKSAGMATQLDRRAQMDAERKQISYEAALEYLLSLMAQGWASPDRQKL